MIRPSRPRVARWIGAVLVGGALAWSGLAQTPAPAPSAQTPEPSAAQKKLDAILVRYEKAHADWEASLRDAKSEKEFDALLEKRPGNEYLDEIEVVAREGKGTEAAAKAWAKYATIAAELGNVKQVSAAVEILMDEHLRSPELAVVPGLLATPRVARPDKAERWLRDLIEKSPEKSVQAPALFTLGQRLMEGKKSTDEQKAEGRAMLERVKKDYAGIGPQKGPAYAAMAAGRLFELDHLKIGDAPPDFEAIDENGVAFKLSDYRGKVVIVDFWGNW